jgi:hypothetical protein
MPECPKQSETTPQQAKEDFAITIAHWLAVTCCGNRDELLAYAQGRANRSVAENMAALNAMAQWQATGLEAAFDPAPPDGQQFGEWHQLLDGLAVLLSDPEIFEATKKIEGIVNPMWAICGVQRLPMNVIRDIIAALLAWVGDGNTPTWQRWVAEWKAQEGAGGGW